MADAPATPEQLRPTARPGYDVARVTITYYRGTVNIARPLALGAEVETRECDHLHTTPEAADRCSRRMAARVQREELARFTPCACHGATPSRACVEHPEPVRYWIPDTD